MRSTPVALAAVVTLLVPGAAFAKAAFYSKPKLVEMAEIIAVVDVAEVAAVQVKGTHWTYRQAASATTVNTLKGKLPDRFVIHASKNFICARASYEPQTRYLVFLRKEGDLYTTVNHHLGNFKIAQDKLRWFANDRSLELEERSVDEVLAEIKRLVQKKANTSD